LRAKKFKEANSLRYVVGYVKKNSYFQHSACNFTGLSLTAEQCCFLMSEMHMNAGLLMHVISAKRKSEYRCRYSL